jgi:hypothetical protein
MPPPPPFLDLTGPPLSPPPPNDNDNRAQSVFTDPDDKEYWLPRLHYATDTVEGLRCVRGGDSLR